MFFSSCTFPPVTIVLFLCDGAAAFLSPALTNRGCLRVGAGKMLELLRHADPNMRRGAAETLLQFSKLLEGAPLALRKQLTSRTTLSLLILGLKVRTLTIVATDTAV